ncbi:MAG: hypothetical protein IKN53_06520 [Oscillibacter sp.]|nr:hypothetical protein [Oscillibacter sp.]
MKRRLERILRRYGQRVTLLRQGEETEARAFLQPLRERGEQEAALHTPIGRRDVRLWRYLGTEELRAGESVLWNGARYRVRTCRTYFIGETAVLRQATLESAEEDAE